MKRSCPSEARVVEAAKENGNLETYREHLVGCDVCRDAATVTSWLREVASETERSVQIPEAEAVWWRAQIVKRLCDTEIAGERRGRPLVIAQLTAGTVAVVTLGVTALTSESTNTLIGSLASILGDFGAAIVAVAGLASLLTGGFLAWQAMRDFG